MALYFFDALSLLWLVWLGYWVAAVIYERTTSTAKQTERRARGAFPFVFILLLVMLTPIGYAGPLGWILLARSSVIEAVGLAVAASGVALAIWARRHLGTNWSGIPSVKKGHTLITDGPYSIVRHPIYTGLLLGVAGSALVLRTLSSVFVVVVVAVVIGIRIGQEERLMREQFGDEYREYQRKTKTILPWLW